MVRLVSVGLVAAVLLAAVAMLPTSKADLDPDAVKLALDASRNMRTANSKSVEGLPMLKAPPGLRPNSNRVLLLA
jgi:hypothetical protein